MRHDVGCRRAVGLYQKEECTDKLFRIPPQFPTIWDIPFVSDRSPAGGHNPEPDEALQSSEKLAGPLLVDSASVSSENIQASPHDGVVLNQGALDPPIIRKT